MGVCPHIDSDVSDSGEWLSDHIPPPNFDIAQSGNVRKALEAESYFICSVICVVLKDEVFTSELNEVINLYDFDAMMPRNGGNTFNSLLSSWQGLQSIVINVIISAAKFSISHKK